MASSIGSITNITNELSEWVEATSSSIEEMSATIREVAESADHLAKVSEETLSAVEEIIYSIVFKTLRKGYKRCLYFRCNSNREDHQWYAKDKDLC